MVLVFASLSFLVAGFIYVSISERPAIAYSPAYCFTQYHCKDRTCTDKSDGVTRTCCWTGSGYTVCQTCTLNKNTGYYGNCTSVSNFSGGGVEGTDTSPPLVAPEPSPPTQKCPENTVLVPNGNCLPLTNIPEDQQATTQPPDKKPSKHKLRGDDILGDLPQGGEGLTAKKRNNNKDNSPTPPACPTDNSPIPPNCTLKPKF